MDCSSEVTYGFIKKEFLFVKDKKKKNFYDFD